MCSEPGLVWDEEAVLRVQPQIPAVLPGRLPGVVFENIIIIIIIVIVIIVIIVIITVMILLLIICCIVSIAPVSRFENRAACVW